MRRKKKEEREDRCERERQVDERERKVRERRERCMVSQKPWVLAPQRGERERENRDYPGYHIVMP